MLILKPNKQSIKKAVEFLKEGKVIVYPTETCYALGCDATNEKACKRIFEIKKRSKEKKITNNRCKFKNGQKNMHISIKML